MQYDLICIGCGPAGEKAATQVGYFGNKVAIVEMASLPGGAMVNTGTLPSKALRETALVCSVLKRRPLPGQSQMVVDHALSVPRFMAQGLKLEQQEHDRIEASVDQHGIDIHRGRGRLIDANTVAVHHGDGSVTRLTGRNILIATGSSPFRPDHVPFDHPAVVDADGVLNLEQLPRSMIIVGGGVIGCEYGSIFAEIDVAVTLIHPQSRVLPFLDHECCDHLVHSMQERGVTFAFERSVGQVRPHPDNDGVVVTLDDGSTLSADVLLWAAGRQSNTADLGLEEVGVKMGARGLVEVNQKYQTAVESVYAAGDVIGFPALAATSMEQGRIAACDMFNIPFKQRLAEVMPMGIYTIPAVSSVGVIEAETPLGPNVVVGRALYRYNARGRMLGDEQGICKCCFDRSTRKLLGATIVGEQATELIHLAQSLIATGGGIDELIDTCFNYPSLTELYKYAAYDALQALAERQEIRAPAFGGDRAPVARLS